MPPRSDLSAVAQAGAQAGDFYPPKIKRANIQAALSNPNFTLVEGDIRDKECLKKLFEQHRIEKVVHLAARAGVRPSIANPQLYEEVNIKGTLNLLDVCKEFEVEQFIFVSLPVMFGSLTNAKGLWTQRLCAGLRIVHFRKKNCKKQRTPVEGVVERTHRTQA